MAASIPTTRLLLTLAAVLLVAGCQNKGGASKGGSGVPKGAVLTANQKGGIAFFAPERGTVYVVDAETNDTIYSSAIDRAQRLVVFPDRNQIIMNGAVVQNVSVRSDHPHKVYFLKG